MGLTRVAIQRPVFILMLMTAAVLIGALGFQNIQIEEDPEVEFGVVTVTTVYPGAGPEEVNELVTREMEEVVSSVENVLEVLSSSQEGVSIVTIQFDTGTDMDAALNDVRAQVDTVLNELPLEAERPTVQKINTAATPILTMVASSDTLSNRDLRDLIEDQVSDRFARVDGVAQVIVSGGDVREIQVQVKKDRLLAYGIGISDVQRAIQGATLNVPSGRVIDGLEEYSVRVLGQFQSVDEIREMSISINDPNRQGGRPERIPLSEVATVIDGSAERRSIGRMDGQDAVSIVIQKSRDGNAIEVAEAILEEQSSIAGTSPSLLDQISADFGVEFAVVDNRATIVEESITDLLIALFFGIFLVTAIIYVFLHNLRGTIIVGIAIPICLMATLIAVWALGFTLNNMTLLAMSLAIGTLVDDAIVIIENIYRHLKMGEDPVDAALNGRAEIGLAAIAITLADVVVFVSIAFMGGVVGEFFRPLALTFAICVLFSLFVSFTVTPMLASRWYRAGEDFENPTGWFARTFEKVFEKLQNLYGRLLGKTLGAKWYVFGIGFAVLVGVFAFIAGSNAADVPSAASGGMPRALFMMCVVIGVMVFVANIFRRHFKPQLLLWAVLFGLFFPLASVAGYAYGSWKGEAVFKFAFFPVTDQGRVQTDIELPPGSSLERTMQVVRYVEEKMGEHPDVEHVLSDVGRIGSGFGPGNTGPQYARVYVTLKDRKALMDSLAFWSEPDEELRTKRDVQIAAEMLESIGKVPGATVLVTAGEAQGFGRPIQMSFLSNDREALQETSDRLIEGLRSGEIAGVVSPSSSLKPGKPELRVLPDRDRLGDLGISTQALGSAMRTLYEGDIQAKYRTDNGREYDIRVMMDLEDRNDPTLLESVPVTFSQGEPIYVSDIASTEIERSIEKIDRRDKLEEVQISADLLDGFAAGTVQAEIDAWMEREGLIPETVVYKVGGQADVQARESGFILQALALGLILVYMLLASLYNNLLYPFIIQLSQPQALVGALLALMLLDKSLNIVGMIGIIALVGLVGKNAILLVDYTNTMRARGADRSKALIEAGRTRLRPILMTTLALVVGMLPVALAIGRGSEFRETIGIVVIGGITLSTFLTLLVIPASYVIFDDAYEAFGRLLRRRRSDDDGDGSAPAIESDAPSQVEV